MFDEPLMRHVKIRSCNKLAFFIQKEKGNEKVMSYLQHKVNMTQILKHFVNNCKSHGIACILRKVKVFGCLMVIYLETINISRSLHQI